MSDETHLTEPTEEKIERRGGLRTTSWKPGQSGNPNGAPKKGESWAEVFRNVGNMTGEQAAKYCSQIASDLGKLGSKVTLKEAAVLRVFQSLIFEPSPGILNIVLERVEGKVVEKVEVEQRLLVMDE